jgi:hypothetical protein
VHRGVQGLLQLRPRRLARHRAQHESLRQPGPAEAGVRLRAVRRGVRPGLLAARRPGRERPTLHPGLLVRPAVGIGHAAWEQSPDRPDLGRALRRARRPRAERARAPVRALCSAGSERTARSARYSRDHRRHRRKRPLPIRRTVAHQRGAREYQPRRASPTPGARGATPRVPTSSGRCRPGHRQHRRDGSVRRSRGDGGRAG